MKNKLFFCLVAVTFAGSSLWGQQFNWSATVKPIHDTGFTKVLLTADITSKLKQDFSDIRIKDQEKLDVPYLLYKDEAVHGLSRFVTYQMVASSLKRGCCSFITVRNSSGKPIDHIVLEVNNADASRKMTLSGSYDGNRWFAVKDNYHVETFNGFFKGEKKTTSLIRFDFPLTDYTYYKFDFDDWHYWWYDYHYPVFVLRAGYVEPTFIPERCLTLPTPVFTVLDSPSIKQTVVLIDFSEPQYIDHIKFEFEENKLKKDYYRSATLYERLETNQKGKKVFNEVYLNATVLSSLNDNELSIGGHKKRQLVLRINNEDDRPLHLSQIKALQVKHYLVSSIVKGQTYTLVFGNNKANAPVYDLQYFKNKIPDSLTVVIPEHPVALKRPKPIKKQENKKSEEAGFFKNKLVIWIAIGLVAVLLLFMVSRMLRELKNQEKNNG